jgi:hypothetical protein
MISILIFCIFFLLITTFYFAYKSYNFSTIILNLETQIEESLDILQERYNNIGKILDTDVFFDSIEVRQVIEDINVCHQSILLIAEKLTQDFEEENEIKKENSDVSKEKN